LFQYQPRVSAQIIIKSIGIKSRHIPFLFLWRKNMAAKNVRYSIVSIRVNNSTKELADCTFFAF